jgi:hypothetical protein
MFASKPALESYKTSTPVNRVFFKVFSSPVCSPPARLLLFSAASFSIGPLAKRAEADVLFGKLTGP